MSTTATAPQESTQVKSEKRDEGGRFAKGNPGGPGNPRARQTAAFRRRIRESMTVEHFDEVIEALFDKAKEGNMQAIKLVLAYVIGKPSDMSWVSEYEIDPPQPAADQEASPPQDAPARPEHGSKPASPPPQISAALSERLQEPLPSAYQSVLDTMNRPVTVESSADRTVTKRQKRRAQAVSKRKKRRKG